MKRFFLLCSLALLPSLLHAQVASSAAAQTPPQPQVIAPTDNLIVEGVPAIPAALAERIGRYTEFRSAGFSDWHPTRREMLIGTRFADTPQVHRVTTPGGARQQLTFYPDRVGGAHYDPQAGRFFIFSKDIGGGEWFQFYRYDFETGDVTLITDGKSRNTDAVLSHTGKWMTHNSTRRNRKDTDQYIVDPSDPRSDRMLLQLEGGGWGAADWSADDSRIALLEGVSANESYLWLVDVASAQKTLLTPKGGSDKVSYEGAKFSRDGKGLYVTTDKDSEFHRLAYLDLAGKQFTYLTDSIPWDVEDFDLSDDGKTIAFVSNEDGVGVLHLLDTATRRISAVAKMPAGSVGGVKWHKNNRDLAIGLVSARGPADVWSLDVKTGKFDRWTYSETGGLNTSKFSEPELVKWKTFDGKNISGFLYKPDAGKFAGKRPVIVNIHGGPEGQSRPGFLGRSNYLINELGVAVIFPNVRGSTGYGKTFLAADNGFKREDTYKDIDALLDWIKARPDLDGDRIMITGGSYGGHMTLAVATNYNDKICCSLDVVGMSNLVTFLEHTEAYRRDLRRVEYGDERDPKMREFLERIAPMNKVKNITKPLFVVAGKNDPRVPISESEQIVSTVRQNNTPVWFLAAKDEGHGFGKKKNQDFQFYATVLFIQRFLLKNAPPAAQAGN